MQRLKKSLPPKKQKVSTIQDKTGNTLIEANAEHERWTEYCKELYNIDVEGDANILNVADHQEYRMHSRE